MKPINPGQNPPDEDYAVLAVKEITVASKMILL